MIKLENVNKYYNRFKRNQLHVIDNTSLTLGDTGLVAFLGESGCGKTTLLNAIGGLNKVNSGKIYINGKRLPRYSCYRKDKIRTLNIGYIFQDYNLINDISVFDNIALSLKMIGIKNKEEIKRRVNYVLEKVDMYRFRNRMAGALSGGQRQRVGIARAIVKNPSVIIADEPTGNLDSKNTIEIMNIIKAISKERLVILVTHEKNIAKFYASKIVNLEDGKIINIIEDNKEAELDYRMDNKIYLKDFESHQNIKDSEYDIDIYSSKKDKVKLDIIVRNGNIYIKSKNNQRLEIIDEDSNIEVVNDSYKKITNEDYLSTNFDLSQLENTRKLRYTSIYNPFTMIKDGINRVLNYKLLKKILLLGFLASSMFIEYSISNITAVTQIKDKDFVEKNREYVYINSTGIDKYNELKNYDGIEYVLPGDSLMEFSVVKDDIYQFREIYGTMKLSVSGASMISDKDIIAGTVPNEKGEIVLDKMVFDGNYKSGGEFLFRYIDVNNYEEMIGLTLKIGEAKYKVVGVVDKESPSVYFKEEEFQNLLFNDNLRLGIENDSEQYKLYEGASIELKKGNYPVNDYEVIVNIDQQESMPLNKEIDDKINDRKLKVVGYYYSVYENNTYYVNSNMINYLILKNHKGFSVYSKNKDNIIKSLTGSHYNPQDTYKLSKDEYVKNNKDQVRNSLIVSIILLIISFVEIFFMTRASFLTKVKEIGIKRAIGIKKMDIYKMFMGEILVITTITGVPGVILMSAVLKELSKISFIGSQYVVNTFVIIVSFILIYGFNLIIGLLPVFNLLRKEPADILSRTDVD